MKFDGNSDTVTIILLIGWVLLIGGIIASLAPKNRSKSGRNFGHTDPF